MVYDPANPLRAKALIPYVSRLEVSDAQIHQFRDKMNKSDSGRQCAFLAARCLFNKNVLAYYGYGDGAEIYPEFLLHTPRSADAPVPAMQNTRE